MQSKKNEYIIGLSEFCSKSMDWCSAESEASITKINDILSLIMEDSERVSAVSKDTLDAIDKVREMIDNLASEGGNRDVANQLASALTTSAEEDEQMKQFIKPVMESLQFQDRISQNMKNFAKMIRTWVELRIELQNGKELTDSEKISFGEHLLSCTTMKEEREIIRKYIENLPEEKSIDTNSLFF